MNALAATAPRRRYTDKLVRSLMLMGVVVALIPLVLVLSFVIARGVGALNWNFFTTDPTGAFIGNQGGIKSAILGSIETVALATVLAVPLGIALAVYLVEVGRRSKLATTVRYFIDVLTGVPSIVFGLFIYITLVVSGTFGGFAAWKGSVALALLMLPVVTRASEVALNNVSNNLREAALALGAPRWRMITQIVLPTALPGLLTGSLLAVARASGETAPLLFTMLGAQATTFALGAQMNSLPLQIFDDIRQPNPQLITRAWGAALTLIAMILLVNVAARLAARRSHLR
jgi:phosphate transport system permease protein